MAKPFDATSKMLIGHRPADWLALTTGEVPRSPIRLIDADASTVTADADTILLVDDPYPWLVHIEFQVSRDRTLPARILRYNVLLSHNHGLPTESFVILLRPRADGRELNGRLRQGRFQQRPNLSFRYKVIRVWTLPVESFLEGGIGTLPLALLANIRPESARDVVRVMASRVNRELAPAEADTFWAATWILAGLRYPSKTVDSFLEGVREMWESSTYRAAVKRGIREGREQGRLEGRLEGHLEGHKEGQAEGLDQGKLVEAREILLRIGEKRFGAPSDVIRERLERIDNREFLERQIERLLTASGWPDILGDLGQS